MKASQLVEQLQTAIRQHGDLPVTVMDGLDPADQVEVSHAIISNFLFFTEASERRQHTKHVHLV